MQERQRVEVFRAQTENLRELERSWKHINRQINALLLANNAAAVNINTKVLALIYCALAEALFSKISHTPRGLSLDDIQQVKTALTNGVKNGWLKCLELAMRKVQEERSGHVVNVTQRLQGFINNYIFDPSLLRNKLAHGQWVIALNRKTDAENHPMTAEIGALNVVDLYRKKSALQQLAAILEDIIESPDKAHHRDYLSHLDAFERDQRKMAEWTLDKKIETLRLKAARAPRKI